MRGLFLRAVFSSLTIIDIGKNINTSLKKELKCCGLVFEQLDEQLVLVYSLDSTVDISYKYNKTFISNKKLLNVYGDLIILKRNKKSVYTEFSNDEIMLINNSIKNYHNIERHNMEYFIVTLSLSNADVLSYIDLDNNINIENIICNSVIKSV